MSINILMPALSPTMTEGKLAKWHVKEGDTVKSGQVICEIETDKATMEVEAVDEGKIGRLVVAEGAEGVKVNAVIAVLLEEGETEVPKDAAAPAAAPAAAKPGACGSACRRTGSGRAQARACRHARVAARSGLGRHPHLRVAARQAHCSGQGPRSSRASKAADRTAASSRPTSKPPSRAHPLLLQQPLRRLARRRRPAHSRCSWRRATRACPIPRSARSSRGACWRSPSRRCRTST